jgi:hemerythrin-like metal-binding protein
MRERYWRPELLTGIHAIDEEHERILAIAQAVLKGAAVEDRSLTARMLNELGSYIRTHFAHEEAIMEELGYPNAKEHKATHQRLAAELETLLAPDALHGDRGEAFRRVMFEWILEHIFRHDKPFARFALARAENERG